MSELHAASLDRDRDQASAVSNADSSPDLKTRVSEGSQATETDRRAAPAETLTRAEYAELIRRNTSAGRDDRLAGAGERNVDRDDAPVDDGPARRPDIAARYPADYTPASGPPPRVDGPHEPPDGWADGINPDRRAPGRDNNCGECSRAVDSTWNGKPAAAAAMTDPDAHGERVARMTEWAGEAPARVSLTGIGQRLVDLGPGSSAVVGCDWEHGGGHWFNAVNDAGIIKAVDGQSGRTETWPPSAGGLGFDESDMWRSDAIFFTADGKVVPR